MVGEASLLSGLSPMDGTAPLPEQEQGWGGSTAPPVLAVTRTHWFSQQCVCPHQPGLVSPSFLIHCPPSVVSAWGTPGQSRGGDTDQGWEEKLYSLQACPAPGLVLWEAKEGKQSFPRHHSQGPSVSPRSLATAAVMQVTVLPWGRKATEVTREGRRPEGNVAGSVLKTAPRAVWEQQRNLLENIVQKEPDTNHPCFFFQSADMDRGT